jgi:hypothetical protein
MVRIFIGWAMVPLATVIAVQACDYPLASLSTVADIGITSLVPANGDEELNNNAVIATFPSNRTISIVLSTTINPVAAGLDHEYSLSSIEDSHFQPPRPALRSGLDRQVVGFIDDHTAVTETRLHLVFDTAMQPDTQYMLRGPGLAEAGTPLIYQPPLATASIQVNQIGYAPGADKYAYIGNWLGTAGALPIDDQYFLVIDEINGNTVYRGELTLRAIADPWSGNDVYEADFSALREPGRYYLQLPGIGYSDHFSIASNVYDRVYRSTARYFYHHRNHSPITAPWATPGYERDQGMSAEVDGTFHPGVAASPLGSGEIGYREITGGWFDAGDYGQYIPNAAPIWYVAGAAMDVAAERFRDGDFNIPESGNGIPDLLDELEWGMDWALAMQDENDGGVWFRIASEQWDSSLPAEVSAVRYIGEKTTHATAAFAAMAAIHSRLLTSYRPERAARTLAAAKHAWRFLENQPQWPAEGQLYSNPQGTHAGTYADNSAIDNRMWAAAELYRSTGEARYHDAYKNMASQVRIDPTAVVSFRDQSMAALWAYLNADWPDRDPSLHAAALESVVAGAQWRLRVASEHPFRASVHPHMPFLGWGSFAHSTRATLPLMQAWFLTGDELYRQQAWSTPHVQLGVNPQALCYITGLGQRSPRFPLSKLSQYDNVSEPLPGIPVNGPHYYLPASWASTRAVNQGYYPSPSTVDNTNASYPPLRRFTDSQYLPPMTEPTIAEAASIAIAYGLLREEWPTGLEAESLQ